MRQTISIIAIFILFRTVVAAATPAARHNLLHELQDSLTSAIVHDGFSPPVASRIYGYTSVAAFEALRLGGSSEHPSLSGRLNGFSLDVSIAKGEQYNYQAAMVMAFCKVAKEMVYRDFIIDTVQAKFMGMLAKGNSKEIMERSEKLGLDVAAQILKWAGRDHYKETRNMPRYTPKNVDGCWAPTPPTYSTAVEPFWGTIRPFVMDSSTQFILEGPPKFSKEKDSEMYKRAIEVMEYSSKADSVQQVLCLYWDCNPLRTYIKAHVMYNARQLTPGGHWMAIAKYACNKKGFSEMESAWVYAMLGVAEADAFIACWEEKYRTDFVRPETYINKFIDKNWKPMLETPGFPEYPSGHSVVSATSAAVLTDLFGENFSYIDSSEVDFHMNIRQYNSFKQAADEAAMSRVYGGIHYMNACEDGKKLGVNVGNLVLTRLKKE